jgi:putative phosphoesterase
MAKSIGVLSDTHGFLEPRIFHYFEQVDEIWHAGDIGDLKVLDDLQAFKPTRAVFGNIDNAIIRRETSEFLRFKVEEVEVLITHIAGKPGSYSVPLNKELQRNGVPKILVCGHSHITLVKNDLFKNMLWMNPGACGNKGFHTVKTILRFTIDGTNIKDLECIELGKRSAGII